MALKNYETLFILTPSLSQGEAQKIVDGFKDVLQNQGAEVIHTSSPDLKSLAYRMKRQRYEHSGFYCVIEFKSEPHTLTVFTKELKANLHVIRILTVSLDKHGVAYNQAKRQRVEDTQHMGAQSA